jgi:hypothetical protein
MKKKFRIGIVGSSRDLKDSRRASLLLKECLSHIMSGRPAGECEIVSGYSGIGIPLLAYQLADAAGIATVGLSAREVLEAGHALFPVSRVILKGEHFGDESGFFVGYIDALIRIGGGPQSRREVKMFRDLQPDRDLSNLLFEVELD